MDGKCSSPANWENVIEKMIKAEENMGRSFVRIHQSKRVVGLPVFLFEDTTTGNELEYVPVLVKQYE